MVEPVQKSGKMFRWWEGRVGDGYVVRMGREETLPSTALPPAPAPTCTTQPACPGPGRGIGVVEVVRKSGKVPWVVGGRAWEGYMGKGGEGETLPPHPSAQRNKAVGTCYTEIHPKGRHAIRKARVVLIVMVGVFPFDFCPIAVIEASS